MKSTALTKACLTSDQLRLVLQAEASLDPALEHHLETCEACQVRLDTLSDRETLNDYRLASAKFWKAALRRQTGQDHQFAATFGRYEIEELIGRGGMAEVYRARDRELDRPVAIKVLSRFDHETSQARFEREAQSLSRLEHPHIVPVLTSGTTDDGRPFLVMPLVDGETLKTTIARRSLDPPQAAKLIRQVAEGLHAAHQAGLIHRDVKLTNVLLDQIGNARLLDFGLVRGATDETLTKSETICGTPEYMSPEQANHFEKADARSDVYSLGITLYECLTGTVPFRGRPLDVLSSHRDLNPVPPGRLNRTVPRDLDTICLKSLRKDPRQRYPTAAAFAADLSCFLHGLPISARSAGSIEKLWRWASRNRALSTAMLLLLLALMTGTAVSTALWRRSERHANLAEERNEALLASQRVPTRRGLTNLLASRDRAFLVGVPRRSEIPLIVYGKSDCP